MRILSSFLFTLTLIAFSLSNTSCSSDAQSKSPEEEEDERPSVPVEAAMVETGEIAAFYTGTASLEAEEEALVVAKTGGVAIEILAEEGQYVEEGQALVRLDSERLTLELLRAEAALARLRQDYERNEELFQKSIISTVEYERIKADYETQQAARDLAQLEVTYATVRAPFSGIISERLIKKGNMVATHAPTFRLTDFDPLLAVMHVPEGELNKLRKGQRAELRLDALFGEVFTGVIKRISPIVDPTTGTFKVTIEVRNRSRQLKPGMFGRIRIVYDTRTDVLLVPKEAILAEDDESAVYVVRDSLAYRQIVETGYSNDEHMEVISGIEAGDIIITTGHNSLRDSSKVEVIN